MLTWLCGSARLVDWAGGIVFFVLSVQHTVHTYVIACHCPCEGVSRPACHQLVIVMHSQGGHIFCAGGSLAGAGYCRQCRQRPTILPLQLWQGCQVCVKIPAQRLPSVAQFNAL